MIKSFENYSVKQRISGGYTQWKKEYEDGEFAYVCVDDVAVTRALVRSAFRAQENGEQYGQVFTKNDASHLGLSK
jgi:hypothetical protein